MSKQNSSGLCQTPPVVLPGQRNVLIALTPNTTHRPKSVVQHIHSLCLPGEVPTVSNHQGRRPSKDIQADGLNMYAFC